MWLIWHKAVAINYWRGRISKDVNIECKVCPGKAEETVLHHFWECPIATWAWQWVTHLMKILLAGRNTRGPWCLVRGFLFLF
jgi:hypothetical protein